MKPDLTFRRSMRMIAKRWWLLLVGGVVVAAAAFVLVGHKPSHYQTSTILTLNDVTVAPSQFGPGITLAPANPKFSADWQPSGFLSEHAAQVASQAAGG
ncbi:MAG TPA: hypothetical protein VFP22_06365, partial [Candidatus Limnocylindrales bacterium]|nr:hypothetical protein [Candidatus Limnocylindrales bacterium]